MKAFDELVQMQGELCGLLDDIPRDEVAVYRKLEEFRVAVDKVGDES